MSGNKRKKCRPEDLDVRISGRTLYHDSVLYLLHSASYVEFEFTGCKLEAEIESEGGGEDFQAWLGVHIGQDDGNQKRFSLQKGINRYLLWESEYTRTVCIRIVKMSEDQHAFAAIHNFLMDENDKVRGTESKKHCIEFIGDSITCGFGNEGNAGDLFKTGTENPLRSYAVLSANLLDCEYQLTAWSGSGILSSWILPDEERPNTQMLIPDIYPYTDYCLYKKMGWEPIELYDFERDLCDIIVANVGTNDASYTKNSEERKRKFMKQYGEFLKYLRKTHPGRVIVCTAGAAVDILNEEIKEAVMLFARENKDTRIYYMEFSQPETEDGEGAVGHPSLIRHEKMAGQLADWIRKNEILDLSDRKI